MAGPPTAEELALRVRQCHMYMQRKKRCCGCHKAAGSDFCVVHREEGEAMVAAGRPAVLVPPLSKAKAAKRRRSGGDGAVSAAGGAGGEDGSATGVVASAVPSALTKPSAASGEDSTAQRRRVQCSHCHQTVYADRLERHIFRCNIRIREAALKAEPYYSEGINAGSAAAAVERATFPLSRQEFAAFAAKIAAAYEAHVGDIPERVLSPAVFDPLRERASLEGWRGVLKPKHLDQHISLVGHLEQRGLLSASKTYVELGCGRGGLSWCIGEVCPDPGASFVLVDRDGARLKVDGDLRTGPGGSTRVRVDITDLKLSAIPSIPGAAIVGVGKHLCGGATDAGLRCLVETRGLAPGKGEPAGADSGGAAGPGEAGSLDGVAIATCCHHRCDWPVFVGKEVWTKELGLSEREFDVARALSSWGVSDHRPGTGALKAAKLGDDSSQTKTSSQATEANDDANEHSAADSRGLVVEPSAEEEDLEPAAKSRLGRQCKRLIDYCRGAYVARATGLTSEIVHYCKTASSPENALLIASRK